MRPVLFFACFLLQIALIARGADITPWVPPFGLDRVGHMPQAEGLEADAEAHPLERANPVDLGAVFVPAGTLLVNPGERSLVKIAAISHERDLERAQIRAWFESEPKEPIVQQTNLIRGVRADFELSVSAPRSAARNDQLHVAIFGDSVQYWHKTISVMLVQQKPAYPKFGAIETKLRYDLPITINSGEGGKLGALSYLKYDEGWDSRLQDVVVCLPNGSRWVFWRGSSYIPFWVTQSGVGLCYEWAETTPPADGVDCVEPLMDKELRYSRVQIVESTSARVHVRWTYQSTDLHYKVWGDRAAEDFYFYPDGFGTRVLTLQRRPQVDYELSEFIVLSPPGAYPLRFVPTNAVEMLYFTGEKLALAFPPGTNGTYKPATHRRDCPVVYAVRGHREDPGRAIYFYPSAAHYPAAQFPPFQVAGQVVTPAYWGSHWPLSRGKSTGYEIDDRVELSPAHNSLLTWGMGNRPPPLSRADVKTVDSLGRSREMTVERWAWLIALTDAPDSMLLDWARSFASPPSLEVEGAQLEFEAYAPERRAIRLSNPGKSVLVRLTPAEATVNPVFEFTGAPKELASVELEGRVVPPSHYAWDGHVLWLNVTVVKPATLKMAFR